MPIQCPKEIKDTSAVGGTRQCKHVYNETSGAKDCGRHKMATVKSSSFPNNIIPVIEDFSGTFSEEDLIYSEEDFGDSIRGVPDFVNYGFRDLTNSEIGVDSGTVAVGTTGTWTDLSDDWLNEYSGEGWSYEGNFISPTAFGDGVYSLVKVKNRDGETVGAEVIFDSSEEMEEWRNNPRNTDPYREEVWNDETEEYELEEDADINEQDIHDEAIVDIRPAGHPDFGRHLRVNKGEKLTFGDPCYGVPSAEVDVAAGHYGVFVHRDSQNRPLRIGAYLIES